MDQHLNSAQDSPEFTMPLNAFKDATTDDLVDSMRGNIMSCLPVTMGIMFYLAPLGIHIPPGIVRENHPFPGPPMGGEITLVLLMLLLFFFGFLPCPASSIAARPVKLTIVTALLPWVVLTVLHMRSQQARDAGNRRGDIPMIDRSPWHRGGDSTADTDAHGGEP